MTEIKCISCKNYKDETQICTIKDDPYNQSMAVNQINKIWGITFLECNKYEVKDD